MKRYVPLFLGVAALVLIGLTTPAMAQRKYPVSVGFTYGTWSPTLDGYNSMFVEQSQKQGDSPAIRSELTTDLDSAGAASAKFLFESSWGFGFNARIRLHNDVFAMVEYDWWSQEVASQLKRDNFVGIDRYELQLNPVIASLVYQLPTEANSKWWPKVFLGFGAGAVTVNRTSIQIFDDDRSESSATGSGFIYQGMAGVEYVLPFSFLKDRLSLMFEARYIGGGFEDSTPMLDANGYVQTDDEGQDMYRTLDVGVQGTSMKFGMSVNFGEIRNRPEKGVLTGFLEQRSRRSGGFAMAPMSGYGSGGGGGGGVTIVYPQASDQVQVVEGAPQIDEDRLRQIIRDEMLGARMSASGPASRSVDSLAEEQLMNVRQRRLQALQELEQLKELLREEG